MSEMTSNAAAPHEAQAVSSMTMIQALRSGLDVMMAKDDNVIVYGEDVGYFGGVFRVTEGLQKKYGKTRRFDAPISEAGIVGTAIGMPPTACARPSRSSLPITCTRHTTRSSPSWPACATVRRAIMAPITIRMPGGAAVYGGVARPKPRGGVHPCERSAHRHAQQPD